MFINVFVKGLGMSTHGFFVRRFLMIFLFVAQAHAVNEDWFKAIDQAIGDGKTESLQTLYDKDNNIVNAQNDDGQTVLHVLVDGIKVCKESSIDNYKNVFSWLLSKKELDINQGDSPGKPPLCYSDLFCRPEPNVVALITAEPIKGEKSIIELLYDRGFALYKTMQNELPIDAIEKELESDSWGKIKAIKVCLGLKRAFGHAVLYGNFTPLLLLVREHLRSKKDVISFSKNKNFLKNDFLKNPAKESYEYAGEITYSGDGSQIFFMFLLKAQKKDFYDAKIQQKDLWDAVHNGYSAKAIEIINAKSKKDLENEVDGNNDSPLMWAIRNKRDDVLAVLLKKCNFGEKEEKKAKKLYQESVDIFDMKGKNDDEIYTFLKEKQSHFLDFGNSSPFISSSFFLLSDLKKKEFLNFSKGEVSKYWGEYKKFNIDDIFLHISKPFESSDGKNISFFERLRAIVGDFSVMMRPSDGYQFKNHRNSLAKSLEDIGILLKNATNDDVLKAEKYINLFVPTIKKAQKSEEVYEKAAAAEYPYIQEYFSVLLDDIKKYRGISQPVTKTEMYLGSPLSSALMLLKAKLLSLASQLGTPVIGAKVISKQEAKSSSKFFKESPADVIVAFSKATETNGMNLTNVISAYVSEASFDNIHDMANKYATDKTWEENKIAHDMFCKWGRNASSRVFYDHARAFGEIIANACDAMLPPGEDIGKFGMGFFSILSYLSLKEGTFDGGTTIELETTFAFKNNQNISYKLIFDKDDKQVVPTIQFFDMKVKSETGTTISIKPKKGGQTFPNEFLQRIKKYIHYFDFFQPLGMEVSYKDGDGKSETFYVGAYSAPTKSYPVTVTVSPELLQVADKGTGISLETCRESLLVPSVSTKGAIDFKAQREAALKNPVCAKVVDFQGRDDKTKSHFLIAVNGVVVVDCPIERRDKEDKDKEVFDRDILILMPKVTQVSLARDDIMILPEGSHFEEDYIKNVISETIKIFLTNETSLSFDVVLGYDVFSNLYYGLKTWEELSANTYIKGIFTKHFRDSFHKVLQNNINLIPCPQKYTDLFKKIMIIGSSDKAFSLLPLDDEIVNYSFERLEDRIKDGRKGFLEKELKKNSSDSYNTLYLEAIEGNLFKGFTIVFADLKMDGLNYAVHGLGLQGLTFFSYNILNMDEGETYEEKRRLVLEKMREYFENSCFQYADTGEEKVIKPKNVLKDNVIENFKDENINVAWVLPTASALRSMDNSIDNVQAIVDSIKSLIGLHEKTKTILSDNFRKLLFNRLNRYFNIQEIAVAHSDKTKITAKQQDDDATPEQIVSFLAGQKKKNNFDILTAMQFNDFIKKTDSSCHKIDPDIVIVPTITANTVFSVLTKLRDKDHTVNNDIIDLIISRAATYQDLLLFCNILLTDKKLCNKLSLNKFNEEKIIAVDAAIKYMLEDVLPNIFNEKRKEDIYRDSQKQFTVKDRVNFFKKLPECGFITSFINNVIDSKDVIKKRDVFLSEFQENLVKKATSFSLQKQLIPAHARGKGLDCNDFSKTIKIILDQSEPKFKLGKVTQAIEAGSDKDYVQGTLLETFQNSVDAIKDYVKNKKTRDKDITTIDYNLGYQDKDDGHRHICLTIADHIGMASLKIILANLILPDYSEKTPAAGNVGDMGNGLFKIFQQADRVSVVTRLTDKDQSMYILDIVPERNKISNLAEDLNLKLVEIKKEDQGFEKDFYGTAIHVKFLPKTKQSAVKEMLYIKDLIFSMLSLADIDFGGGKKLILRFNDDVVLMPKLKQVTMKDGFTIKECDDKNKFISSLITTMGVPFRRFGPFCKAMELLTPDLVSAMSFNVVVDVGKDLYEPVQSRTKLQMTPENKEKFKKVLHDFAENKQKDEKNK